MMVGREGRASWSRAAFPIARREPGVPAQSRATKDGARPSLPALMEDDMLAVVLAILLGTLGGLVVGAATLLPAAAWWLVAGMGVMVYALRRATC